MVGDRERIDADFADVLVARLHAAGFELHKGLAVALNADARAHIEAAIDELDLVIRLVRIATVGEDPET